jgi:hypothetical protein
MNGTLETTQCFLACFTNPCYNNANQWKNDHYLPILQRHVSDQGPPAIAARFFPIQLKRSSNVSTVSTTVSTTCQFAKRINKTDCCTICLVQASDLVGKKHQDLKKGSHLESNTPCLKHRSKPPFVAGQTSSSIVGSLPSFHSFNRHHVNFGVSILQNRHSHFSRQMSSNEIP